MARPVLTANSPSAGSIAWSAFNIAYGGKTRAIPAGNTASRFVWWLWNGGSPKVSGAASAAVSGTGTLETGNALPTNLTDNDLVLFVNRNGIPISVQNANVVDGSLIVNESIVAASIAAGTVTGDKMVADTLTAREISAGAIRTSELSISALGPEAEINGELEDWDPATNAPASWLPAFERSGAPTYSQETAAPISGSSSTKISVPASAVEGMASRAIPCNPGDLITVASAVRTSVAGGPVGLRVYFGAAENFTRTQVVEATPAAPTNVQITLADGTPMNDLPTPLTGPGIAAIADGWATPQADVAYAIFGQVKVPPGARFYRVVPVSGLTTYATACVYTWDWIRNRPTTTSAYLGDGAVQARHIAVIGEIANGKSRVEVTAAKGIELITRSGAGVDTVKVALDLVKGAGRFSGSIDVGLLNDSFHVDDAGNLWSGAAQYTPGFSGPATLTQTTVASDTAASGGGTGLYDNYPVEYVVAAVNYATGLTVPTRITVPSWQVRYNFRHIKLDWTHGVATSHDRNEYRIFRRQPGAPGTYGQWARLAQVISTGLTYTDTGVAGVAETPPARSTFKPPFLVRPTGELELNEAGVLSAALVRSAERGRRVELGAGSPSTFDLMRFFTGDAVEFAGNEGRLSVGVTNYSDGTFPSTEKHHGYLHLVAPDLGGSDTGASLMLYGRNRDGSSTGRATLIAGQDIDLRAPSVKIQGKEVPRGRVYGASIGQTGSYQTFTQFSGAGFSVVSGRRYILRSTCRLVGTGASVGYTVIGIAGVYGHTAAANLVSGAQGQTSNIYEYVATATGTVDWGLYGQFDNGSGYHHSGYLTIEDVGT